MPRSQLPGTDGPIGPPAPDAPPPRRGPSKVAVTAAVLALVSGAWLMHIGTETHAPPAPSPSDALLGAGRHGGAPGAAAVMVTPLPASVPVRMRIPAIKVDAPVMKLGVDGKNEIQVPPPANTNMAGWYEYGASPGAAGAAVLLGHVDTLKGPAVFYNLGSLHKGNTIEVTRADHRTAVFTVYGIEVYAKSDFPTDRVYNDTPTPELRVITCGGGFSKSSHSYLGNVVVYARLTGSKAGPAATAKPSAPASVKASVTASVPVRASAPARPSAPARAPEPLKASAAAPAVVGLRAGEGTGVRAAGGDGIRVGGGDGESRLAMWEWLTHGYHTRIVESGRQPLFLLLVGLLASFLFIRFSTRMIRRGTSWWPGNVQPGGLHIHHVVFGLGAMLIGGIGSFAVRGTGEVGRDLLGLLFGIGCGLVLDEFALVLHLKDVYWSEEGRQSVDAVILAVGVIGLLLLGVTPLGNVTGPLLSRAVAIGLLLALVVVTLLKGKVWTGFFGLFLVFLPVFGAIRLARPNSPWARWRYYSRPRRLARAERREARVHGRLQAARRTVYNAVAGAPARPVEAARPAGPARPAEPARKRPGRRRPSTAGLGPSRTERFVARLREPAVLAVVWYLRLAVAWDVVTALVVPFRSRLHRAAAGEVLTPFLFSAGFTSAVFAALLAVMLRRRKRAAWIVAFALAAVNTVGYWLAVLTGPAYRAHPVSWLSAGLTTLVAAALWIARPACRVRGEHGNGPRGLAWLVCGGAAAVGVGTVLVHATNTVRAAGWPDCLRYALLRVFTLADLIEPPDITVPGWVDLSINVLSVALLLQVLRAFFRSPLGRARLAPDDESRLRFLLRRFGAPDSVGYFALRRDSSVSWSPDRDAAVVYRVVNGVALASGDPVGDRSAWPAAIGGWLRTARGHAWVPAVAGASQEAAGVYERRGMRTLAFGDEAVARTGDFGLDGEPMRPLRETRQAMRAAGYSVVVRRQREIPGRESDRLVALADAWRRGAGDGGFAMSLARLGDRADAECVLVECRDPHDRTCALLSLVPWDRDGLSLDLMRREHESPEALFGYMLAELLLRARADAAPVGEVERVALNFTVLHAVTERGRGPGTGRVFVLHRQVVRLLARRRRLEVAYQTVSGLRPGWQPRFLLYERATELPRIALANADADGLFRARRLPRPDPGGPDGVPPADPR